MPRSITVDSADESGAGKNNGCNLWKRTNNCRLEFHGKLPTERNVLHSRQGGRTRTAQAREKTAGYCRTKGRGHRHCSRDPRLPRSRRAKRASRARRRKTTPRPGLRSPVGIPESQLVLGLVPEHVLCQTLLRPRSASGTRQCRERKTPKVDRQGRVGGSRRVCRRLTLVFLVLTLAWGYHLLSPANSLAVRQPSQPATDG